MAFWLFQYLKSRGDNFGQVSPTVYRSADPGDKLTDWIHRYKLEAVLDLRAEQNDEWQTVGAAGIIYQRVLMRDDEAPAPKLVKDALDVLTSGLVTLVHCKGGRHRTGVIVACYDVLGGKTPAEAWKSAEKYGWYDTFGHKPIRLWFENQFKPEDYR